MTDEILDPLYTLLVRGEIEPTVTLTALAVEKIQPSLGHTADLTVLEIVEQLLVSGDVLESPSDTEVRRYVFTQKALRSLLARIGYREHIDLDEGIAELRALVNSSAEWMEQRLLLDAFWPQAHEMALIECPSISTFDEAEGALALALRSRPIRMHVDRSEVFQLEMNRSDWTVTWVKRAVRSRLVARILGHVESVVSHSRWLGDATPPMMTEVGRLALARIGRGGPGQRAYPSLDDAE